MTDWMKNDALARRETEKGWRWQRFVGAFFEAHGLSVELPDYSWRASVDQIDDYQDSYDLMVNDERVEVKSRDLWFTSIPTSFPYDPVFVDTVNSYDHYKVKPIAYIFVSQQTGALLSTPGRHPESVDTWRVEERFDHIRGIQDRFYVVSRDRLSEINVLLRRLRK